MIRINLFVQGRGGAAMAASGAPIGGAGDGAGFQSLEALDSQELQKQGAIKVFIILLGPVLLYLYQMQILPDKAAQLAQAQAQVQELQAKNEKAKTAVSETKTYKDSQTKLTEQISAIDDLRKDRMKEVRVLDLIQRDIPDKLWLSNLSIGAGRVSVQGRAASDAEINQFIDVLSKSIFLTNVVLVRSIDQTFDGVVVKEFNITASLEKKTSGKGGG